MRKRVEPFKLADEKKEIDLRLAHTDQGIELFESRDNPSTSSRKDKVKKDKPTTEVHITDLDEGAVLAKRWLNKNLEQAGYGIGGKKKGHWRAMWGEKFTEGRPGTKSFIRNIGRVIGEEFVDDETNEVLANYRADWDPNREQTDPKGLHYNLDLKLPTKQGHYALRILTIDSDYERRTQIGDLIAKDLQEIGYFKLKAHSFKLTANELDNFHLPDKVAANVKKYFLSSTNQDVINYIEEFPRDLYVLLVTTAEAVLAQNVIAPQEPSNIVNAESIASVEIPISADKDKDKSAETTDGAPIIMPPSTHASVLATLYAIDASGIHEKLRTQAEKKLLGAASLEVSQIDESSQTEDELSEPLSDLNENLSDLSESSSMVAEPETDIPTTSKRKHALVNKVSAIKDAMHQRKIAQDDATATHDTAHNKRATWTYWGAIKNTFGGGKKMVVGVYTWCKEKLLRRKHKVSLVHEAGTTTAAAEHITKATTGRILSATGGASEQEPIAAEHHEGFTKTPTTVIGANSSDRIIKVMLEPEAGAQQENAQDRKII